MFTVGGLTTGQQVPQVGCVNLDIIQASGFDSHRCGVLVAHCLICSKFSKRSFCLGRKASYEATTCF